MSILVVILYALFVLSLFFPFYTYAIYPFVLRILRRLPVRFDDVTPPVSIIVIGKQDRAAPKSSDVKEIDYPDFEVIQAETIRDGIRKARYDILFFTDEETVLDKNAVRELIKPFADPSVGCVVGQQTCKEGNSLFWKYENWVKSLESRIGCVSGVTDSIFAIRKECVANVPGTIRNESFYLATRLSRSGKKIVYQPDAKAYESKKEGTNYAKHIQDAAEYWQAFFSLKTMLIPGKGSFVYISHRVMKWLVCLNMIIALVSSGLLAKRSDIMLFMFLCQVVLYLFLLVYSKCKIKWKPAYIAYYFVSLNVSYMLGFFNYLFRY